jgi:hypothetical protein
LVARQAATLKEVETYYDLVDVFDMNDALDLLDEADARACEES